MYKRQVVVELHDDAEAVILLAQMDEDVGLILLGLLGGNGLALHGLLVDGVDLFLGGLTVGDVVQTVVGSAAAHLGEELDAVGQSAGDAVDAGQLLLADSSGQLDVYKRQDVYELTPARCWKVKRRCASIESKPQ